jgi:hypothetical protein
VGQPPKRCTACRLARERKIKLHSLRRRRAGIPAPTTYTCVDCHGTFPREHPRGMRKRCPSCNDANARRWAREKIQYAAKRNLQRHVDKGGRQGTCEDCGAQWDAGRLGSVARRCSDCGAKHHRAWKRADYAKKQKVAERAERPCEKCDKPFKPFWKGLPARWCKACQDSRGKAQRTEWKRTHPDPHRIAKRGAEAEVINKFEIFDRDKWICQICNKKINKRLQYPSLMRASLDHIIPVSQKGPHVRANVRASHLRCNVARGNRGGGEQLLLLG